MSKKEYYPKTISDPNFPEIEQKILKKWAEENTFKRSVNRDSFEVHGVQVGSDKQVRKEFVFYDGPPFANGLPHYGHLLTGFVKDLFARYQTQKGKKVERKFGWDCHGLPAEMATEKLLGISGRLQIINYGVDKFNDHCKEGVLKYTNEWEQYVTRQARWVDFKNSYKTMDKSYMESVIWAFSELYKKGLVYQSMRVMPYSWACETPLSNFETRLDNSYRERADKAATVLFELKERPKFLDNVGSFKSESGIGIQIRYAVMAWTTTPWTLPSNLALAVGENIDYTCVTKDDTCYILAKSSLKHYQKELGLEKFDDLPVFKGGSLAGLEYKPLFDYFKDHQNAFKILLGDFVVEGDGTGIVHMAPGFGEDDQVLCSSHGIELVCPVDSAGKFTKEVPDFQGMQVFDANDEVIKALKQKNLWLKTEQYLHNYPHCWRTDTPLIYKAVSSWYVKVTEFKDRMVKLNQQINWIPGHIRDGLFGKWLENARDWSISRNRFWGTPIPIWISNDPAYPRIDVYGSIAELERDFGVKVDDLHKPVLDALTRTNPDDPTGKAKMVRVEDVFDCWFESGSMPYAQVHYPFENKDWFEKHFPADFIVEYVAQTRGWFYTLMVLSTALFDRPPFLNCICHGVILDEKGQKLSKRLNNYADPLEIFEKYGADSLRVLMCSATVMKGQELLIDKDGKMLKDVVRNSIKPLWNAYNFFTLYANADGVQAKIIADALLQKDYPESVLMDKYILAKLKETIDKIGQALDSYDSQAAYTSYNNFIEILNNWYIRRNRHRFWRSNVEEYKDQDKQQVYDTLYTVLTTLCRAMASLMPLITEEIYTGLVPESSSVHLESFPEMITIVDSAEIIVNMDEVRSICEAGLSIRDESNMRVRQPLASLEIYSSKGFSTSGYEELIKDEVNVKAVIFKNVESLQVKTEIKLQFAALGKKYPSLIKEMIPASKAGRWELKEDKLLICNVILEPEEFEINYSSLMPNQERVLKDGKTLVKLDLNLTQDLIDEGIARDFVRLIQQTRKNLDFSITDIVVIKYECESENVCVAINKHKSYIEEQTLGRIDDNAEVALHHEHGEIAGSMVKYAIGKYE